MNQTLAKQKKKLREKMRNLQKALFYSEKKRRDQHIHNFVITLKVFEKARRIGLYASVDGECETRALFNYAKACGKQIAFPVVVEKKLEFGWVNSWEELRPGFQGILEPARSQKIALERLDLIFVPGLAFDYQGHRLGQGAGYYDRVLASTHRPRVAIGLAYDFQFMDQIPYNKMDQRMDYVVTDRGCTQA